MDREPDIIIRRAKPGDAPAMADCVAAAYRRYTDRIGRPPGPMLEDYDRVIRQSSAWVASADDRLLGLMVLKLSPGRALLDNVAVHPDGQGRGLGRRLIALAESEVRRAGYNCLELYTNEKMTENLVLYHRLGYLEFDRRMDDGYNRVFMRKSL